MSSVVAHLQTSPLLKRRLWKITKKLTFLVIAVVLLPIPAAVLFATGTLDLIRNKGLNWSTVNRYFFGNGFLTWMLSPLNLLLDVLCFPYWNRGVYKIEQLPEECQEEIQFLADYAFEQQLASRISEQLHNERRGMMMFKWYGKNFETSLSMPEYHKRFQYVQTIGVSVFNRKQSTSLHFGPMRATLRVLYNINNYRSRNAYIQVGDQRHFWADERIFIFDDTLQHQSVNESDELRVCLFIDIIRPAMMPSLLRFAVRCIQKVSQPIRQTFYKNWSFLK